MGLSAVLLSVAQSAAAGSTQTTMNVSATVQNSCLVSASPMLFGNYDPVGAAVTNGTSAITVTCTTGTNFVVGLNAGNAAGATVAARQMSNAAHRLNYSLFSDAARSSNWGNTPGLDTPATTTATGSPSVLTVYGQIAANQNVPGGAYADTVTITVSY
ncbi:spore coat protein U-like protein [Sphingomonas kaistensis]|uniref:Spore coat protein U-like protein n=1 Tax=Sphingomonas kaistensis TaxID=298708 RepID=A0A7X5Y436_9SPHN|nr:spore coat U domain-containing protein [Sphingomonas kaistensis]NJC04380.1 spore coat protein U-like protein [Sphingomonas kaistensis]